MPHTPAEHPASSATTEWFATTHWSMVLAAQQTSSTHVNQALEQLCRIYWFPLYSYIRRRGHDAYDAQDLAQEFFARLLSRNDLGQVDRAKGKFRSFLIASLNHFLANEWDRVKAEKRGGGRKLVSLDDASAEERYLIESVTDVSPEALFEQRWALTLLDQALGRLRREFLANGKSDQFEVLKPFLEGETRNAEYVSASAKLDMTPNAVAVLVHRLRQKYRKLVRAEIAQTVSSPADIDEEMRHLFKVIGG